MNLVISSVVRLNRGTYFVKVEDEIQLTHVLKGSVERLDEYLNQVENA